MKKYQGIRYGTGSTRVVVMDDEHGAVTLQPRLDLINHSPTGFEWGYAGSGPAQLALAILADASDDSTAVKLHQDFKQDFIEDLAREGWEIEGPAVESWVQTKTKD